MCGSEAFVSGHDVFEFSNDSVETSDQVPGHTNDPIVTGVVYRRTLRFVDPAEPLFGTSYIGRTVRAGEAEAIANKRWREENIESVREERTTGLKAALSIFGAGAFENEILETKRGERERVSKWADHREIELIAEYGGPLQDMNPPSVGAVRQTLNLRTGGSFTVWTSIEARCAESWKTFIAELDQYIATEGHADVPLVHVSASGYKLGQNLSSVRSGRTLSGRIDEAERRSLLKAKGVTMSMHDAAWEKFNVELDQFIAAEGHANAPTTHESASGYNLGRALGSVRQGQLLNGKSDGAERRELLERKGVVFRIKDVMYDPAYEEFQKRMLVYVADHETSRVPKKFETSDGYKLGERVANVITHGTYVQKNNSAKPERVAWLEALPGWQWRGNYQPVAIPASTEDVQSIVSRIAAKAREKRKRVQDKRGQAELFGLVVSR